jgi:hypothetical protein
MIHRHRVYRVTAVDDTEELATKLTEHCWTLCTAFQLRDLIFANDSFSADGAQEYAVVRNGRQVESLTVSWCTKAGLAQMLAELVDGTLGDDYGAAPLRIDHPDGPCAHCA